MHFLKLIIEWIKTHLAQLKLPKRIKVIGQNQSLNGFVAGAREDVTFYATNPKVTQYHILS